MKMSWADDFTASTTDSLPSMGSFDDERDAHYGPIGANTMAVEIELDSEAFGALCRRGRRRRLREIQAAFPAILRVDRQRRVLHVIGSPEAIDAIQAQVESLRGPRKTVTSAVWAELMRTRILQDESSVLYRLELASGCRIHIERKQNEVRLFGPPDAASTANKLLDDFAAEVTEVSFDMNTTQMSEESLLALAHKCGVSLRVEDDQVIILGLHANVEYAGREFKELSGQKPPQYDSTSSSEGLQLQVPNYQVLAAQENPYPSGACHGTYPMMGSSVPIMVTRESSGVPVMQNATAPSQACSTQQPFMLSPNFAMAQPQIPAHTQAAQMQTSKHVCPTCGCGHFCTSCGFQVAGWQYIQAPTAPASPPMSPGNGYVANTMFVPMMMAQPGQYA